MTRGWTIEIILRPYIYQFTYNILLSQQILCRGQVSAQTRDRALTSFFYVCARTNYVPPPRFVH